MTKLALQIAVTYLDTEGQLDGTVTDIVKMYQDLTTELGYKPENITILAEPAAYDPVATHYLKSKYRPSNAQPTRDVILSELIRLAERANADPSITEIFFQYSGHGTYIRDHGEKKDEDDDFDECIVPLDYDEPGGDFIPDDAINAVLALFPERVTLIGVVDACHSGTMFDLPYRYISGNKYVIESETSRIKCKCIMFSGCKDTQVSMDAYGLEQAAEYSGAMTTSLRAAWKVYGYTIGVWPCIKHQRRFLSKRTFKQVPQVTTNVRINRGTLLLNCGKVTPFIEAAPI